MCLRTFSDYRPPSFLESKTRDEAGETSISSIFGSVIVAIMFLAVFVGGANAGDFTRCQSAEAFASKSHH